MNKIEIQDAIKKDKIVLFMKGTRNFPQCGFSGRMIDILGQFNVEYQEYDVLQNPELRENIKLFSEWPTIPQLYVDGKLIGGCDIIEELSESGELEKILKPAAN